MNDYLSRSRLLLGDEVMERLANIRVLLVGVGGVGSWCAESLVRTGVKHLTIVDDDVVCDSNVNRQMMATVQTVGEVKVEALKRRLLEISPNADIEALNLRYDEQTAPSFELDKFDYIIDAIDSLDCKMLLIRDACKSRATFFSSMGAALKLDPSRIAVAEFWKVKGCPLGAALRRRFKKSGLFPAKKFKCVFSDELVTNAPVIQSEAEGSQLSITNCQLKKPNGSLSHITAIFGFTLASLVVRDVRGKSE